MGKEKEKEMKIIRKVCSECGSDDLLFEADVTWNVLLQKFEINNIFDDVFCNKCSDATTAIDVDINTNHVNEMRYHYDEF